MQVCYTQFMRRPRALWSAWAERLQQWKLVPLVTWLLEAAGPFALLGAQVLYFSQPFLPKTNLDSVAAMLEEGDELQAFVAYLRGEPVL